MKTSEEFARTSAEEVPTPQEGLGTQALRAAKNLLGQAWGMLEWLCNVDLLMKASI